MKMIYGIKDRPSAGKLIVFAFQQMIAIMAATLLVPLLVSQAGIDLDPAAALFGAGIGTIVYIICTKGRSPVFLGSSFTFIGAMMAAVGQKYGYWGLIIGVGFAGLVYVIIAIVIRFVGTNWLNKLLPAVIIGPIVACIGLSLSGTATQWMMYNSADTAAPYNLIAILCGLVTFFVIVLTSVKGGKMLKLIPFIIGIGAGYLLALVFTLIGRAAGVSYLQVLDFQPFIDTFGDLRFQSFLDYPKFTFLMGIETAGDYAPIDGAMIGNLAILFAPIGVVELAQHIAHHKNLGNIIEQDLIKDPGLDENAPRRRHRLHRGRGVRRVRKHRLRRIGRLRGDHQKRLGHHAVRGGGRLYGALLLQPLRGGDQLHPQMRDGRRVRGALRVHRGERLADAQGSRSRR